MRIIARMSERSEGGIPVHRHDQVSEGGLSDGDPALIAAVEAHLERHIGKPASVYHELVSPHVHSTSTSSRPRTSAR